MKAMMVRRPPNTVVKAPLPLTESREKVGPKTSKDLSFLIIFYFFSQSNSVRFLGLLTGRSSLV